MINQEAVEALKRENEQLKALIVQKDQILHQRSEPQLCAIIDALNVLSAIIDALNVLSQMAIQGNPAAKNLLSLWRQALSNAEAATSGLLVVGNGRRPGG